MVEPAWNRFVPFDAAGDVTWAVLHASAADLFGRPVHRVGRQAEAGRATPGPFDILPKT